jgi:cytochrome c peroxidase
MPLIRRIGALLFACTLGFQLIPGATQERPTGLLPFSDSQVRLILSHGPWPQPWAPDRTNRASGNSEAVALGRRLFVDARIAPSGRISCSSCHRPEHGWNDGRPRSIGLEPGIRNTLSLYNVRLNRWFGWDGAADSLWAQSLRPLIDPREMGSNADYIKRYLGADQDLARAYESIFQRSVSATDAEFLLVDAAKALAAYQETILSPRTPFDQFRDTMASGDLSAAAGYPLAAQRGLTIFIGKGGCNSCHSGAAFTNGQFYNVGIASAADAGRRGGIEKLVASGYNLSGQFNDDPTGPANSVAAQLAQEHQGRGEFRVPTLRNLSRTAPFMHDGSLASLRDVVRHHIEIGNGPLQGDGRRGLRRLALDDQEIADLIAFLETLSVAPSEPGAAKAR